MATTLTAMNFEHEVLNADVPVLVDFWAEWCGPCRMIAPVVEELASAAQGAFKVGKVDADAEQELLIRYGVSALPTLMIFSAGEPVQTLVGVQPKAALLKAIEIAKSAGAAKA